LTAVIALIGLHPETPKEFGQECLRNAIVTYISRIDNLDLQLSLNFILSSVIHTPILKIGNSQDLDQAKDDGLSVQNSSLCFCY